MLTVGAHGLNFHRAPGVKPAKRTAPISLQGMLASHVLTIAGLLALASSIGMGVMTSEKIQVGLYSAGLSSLDAMKAAMPAWLVSKGDLDIPIEFLTAGPIADSVIAATMAAEALQEKVKPRLELVKTMEQAATDLEHLQQNLRMAATTAWQSLEGAGWRRRYRAGLRSRQAAAKAKSKHALPTLLTMSGPSAADVRTWNAHNRTLAAALAANLTRLDAGDLDEVLWAYSHRPFMDVVGNLRRKFRAAAERGDLGFIVTIGAGGGLAIPDTDAAVAAEFAAIEMAVHATNQSIVRRVAEVAEFRLKDALVVEPRLRAIRAAIRHEQSLNTYRAFTEWERERVKKVERAGAHLPSGSAAAAKFEEFLTALQGWGYDFPEDIGRKVPSDERLTRRGLARLLAVAQFRRALNVWVTAFVVSVYLGIVGFGIGMFYSIAFIVNMGILGTARNLVGIVYIRSEGAFRRAQIEEEQKTLRLLGSGPERPKIADDLQGLSPDQPRLIRDVRDTD